MKKKYFEIETDSEIQDHMINVIDVDAPSREAPIKYNVLEVPDQSAELEAKGKLLEEAKRLLRAMVDTGYGAQWVFDANKKWTEAWNDGKAFLAKLKEAE